MRIHQWYKNLIIFIPLIFAKKLFLISLLLKELVGFVCLCLASSSNYIINDIIDAEKDKLHPEKKKRPIASGLVSKKNALTLAILLISASLGIAYSLKPLFVLWPLTLFLSTQLYSLKLKKIPILDVNMIALNFLLRTTAGSVIINVPTSNWLFLAAFLLALFLAFGKRLSELKLLGKKAKEHKKIYEFYTKELLGTLNIITVSLLLASYSFYTFLAGTANNTMMLTIPLATFVVFRYLFLIETGSPIARRTELVFKDKQIMCGFNAWLVLSVFLLYI